MGYEISYVPETEKGKSGARRLGMTVGWALVFLLTVGILWPEGRELLTRLVIPGDPETTLEAAQTFAQALSAGSDLGEAAGNFCRAVLSHGYPG